MYKMDETVAGGRARSILHNNERCLLHKRSKVKIDTLVNCVLLHFKRVFLGNITQLQTARFCVCSFFIQSYSN